MITPHREAPRGGALENPLRIVMRCTLYRNVVGGRSAAGERLVGLEGFEKGREFQPHCFDKQLELAEFGGLLGYAPIMPVNEFDCSAFINRQGRIPAPIHSFKN